MLLSGCCVLPRLALAGVPSPAATSAPPAHAATLNLREVSYAIGYRIGSQFAHGHPQVQLPALIKAIKAAYAGRPPAVPMDVMEQQLEALGRQMHRAALVSFRHLAATNAHKSAAFLRANSAKTGVVSLPSGVQYKVIKVGHGVAPTLASTVVMNYRGELLNGMKFDDTFGRDKPVTYPVERMLPGWREVLPRMHVGAHWKIFIPPAQAYGERGQLPRIGPNEVLVFDIQLLGVKH